MHNPRARVLLGRLLVSPEEVKLRGRGSQVTLSSFFGPSTAKATWECSSCTLKNTAQSTACRACETKRVVGKSVEDIGENAGKADGFYVDGGSSGSSSSTGSKRPRPTSSAAPGGAASSESSYAVGIPAAVPSPPAMALPRGVVLLRGFLSLDDQHALLAAADVVAAVSPFTIPQVRHPFTGKPAFGNVYMAHAGRFWVGTKGIYADVGAADAVVANLQTGVDVPVPPVPPTVLRMGAAAVAAALAREPGAFDSPEWEHPDRFTALFK